MNQSDELTLWLAKGWLETSGDQVQALIVDDLGEQVRGGTPLSDGVVALERSDRRAGDFGMAIAGTLLAPVLVRMLKEFWDGYLKELEMETEGALAKKTVELAKHWFGANLIGKRDSVPLERLKQQLEYLVAEKKLTAVEKARLLHALQSDRLQEHLGAEG